MPLPMLLGIKLLPTLLGFAYEDHHNMDLAQKGRGLVYKDQRLILVLLLMALGLDPDKLHLRPILPLCLVPAHPRAKN